MNGAFCETTPVIISDVSQGLVLGPLLFLVHINCVSSISLAAGPKLTIYSDDILLYKLYILLHPETMQPHLPPGELLLGDCALEQVYSYCYLGILLTSTLTWKNHVEQICTKTQKLAGMLYGQFSTNWADVDILT